MAGLPTTFTWPSLVKDINKETTGGAIVGQQSQTVGNQLFYTATTNGINGTGQELWVTDGT